MKRPELIGLFAQLGKVCEHLGEGKEWESFVIGITDIEFEKLLYTINRQFIYNGWFTKENVQRALLDWSKLLTKEKMEMWLEDYSFSSSLLLIRLVLMV